MGYQNNSARPVALGGVLAALGLCVMCLGSVTGIATYVSPMFCALLLEAALNICGARMAWAWYGAVAVLSLLLVTDREAAWVFVFLGYYPIIKPWLDRRRMKYFWKALLFNGLVALLYWLLIRIFGLADLSQEWETMSLSLMALLLILGNVSFFLLDKVLEKPFFRKLGRYGR